jgi:hypothetical protein
VADLSRAARHSFAPRNVAMDIEMTLVIVVRTFSSRFKGQPAATKLSSSFRSMSKIARLNSARSATSTSGRSRREVPSGRSAGGTGSLEGAATEGDREWKGTLQGRGVQPRAAERPALFCSCVRQRSLAGRDGARDLKVRRAARVKVPTDLRRALRTRRRRDEGRRTGDWTLPKRLRPP